VFDPNTGFKGIVMDCRQPVSRRVPGLTPFPTNCILRELSSVDIRTGGWLPTGFVPEGTADLPRLFVIYGLGFWAGFWYTSRPVSMPWLAVSFERKTQRLTDLG